MTKEETLEWAHCAMDCSYFLDTYGYIFDITKNKVDRLTLFPFQKKVLEKYEVNKNNVILKSRQTGISVITAGFIAHKILFHEDERILIIANDGNGARRFLSTVKQFLDYLPKFLLPDTIPTNNTQRIVLSNGSFVAAVASGPNAGRGDTLTCLVLDEAAFIENIDDIWMGSSLALSSKDAKCIMISTPKGTGNLYHSIWTGAQKKENDFVATEVKWTEHLFYAQGVEERTDEHGRKYFWSPWYERQCEMFKYDRVKIAQELDLSFQGSENVVIENHILNKYEQSIENYKPICYFDYKEPGDCFVERETNFWVFEKPIVGANYILSSDVSRGDGADFSTIQILNADTLTQTAEYQGKIAPDVFASVIFKVATDYNKAFVVIEGNNHGLVPALQLRNVLHYDVGRIYHSKSFQKIYVRYADYEYVDANEEIPGFQTTSKTRPQLMSCLQVHMRESQVKIFSKRLLNEFKTFIYNGERPEHAAGYHDDLIFAFAIGLHIRETEFNNIFKSKDFYKAMLDSMSFSSKNGNLVDDQTNKIPTRTNVNPNPTQSPDDDLTWLYGPIVG